MTERESLLRAVLLEPNDLAHRRIYADWLLEYGSQHEQEYASFIHRQLDGHVVLQALDGPAQLNIVWGDNPFHNPPWSSETRWEWRNGFIEVVRCTTLDFLHYSRELFASQPIREVQLLDRKPGPRDYAHEGPRWWIVRGHTWHGEVPYDIPVCIRLAAVLENAMDEVERELIDDHGSHPEFYLEFEDEYSAHFWLSKACVLCGRQRAGLPNNR